MSPAPQGNLQVERYIGSYLISQRPPNAAAKTGKRYQHHHQQQHHVKPKSPEEKARFGPKYCFPAPRDGAGPGPPRFPVPPPGVPVDCPPPPYGHYKPAGDGGGAGWAGVPLISMASGNQRRNRKPPGVAQPGRQHPHQRQPPHQHAYAKPKDGGEEAAREPDRSPLTRLAIHTQGAPLIQAGRYNNRSRANNGYGRTYKGEAVRWEAAKEAKSPPTAQAKEPTCGGNADSLSVASDESSGNSENSLPRIIKPRKRRKKDRKPLTSPAAAAAETDRGCPAEADRPDEPSAPVAFSPSRFPPDPLSAKLLCPPEDHEDLIDPLPSADEFPFGNLLDDDDDDDGGSEASSCAPATLCQCRYCDPSGVIWDVDQRCYSPFLTPPSPSAAFGPGRPAAQQQQRRAARFFDGDLGSLLRRSWSDPSPGRAMPGAVAPPAPRSRPSSPTGLRVSSEIVTSPNGHRDIEIKFYSSSSSTADNPKTKSSATDRGPNERCFVVEE